MPPSCLQDLLDENLSTREFFTDVWESQHVHIGGGKRPTHYKGLYSFDEFKSQLGDTTLYYGEGSFHFFFSNSLILPQRTFLSVVS